MGKLPIPPLEGDGHLLYQDVEDLEHGLPIRSNYYRHPRSGLIFQYPIPSREHLRSLYPPDYRSHASSGIVHRLKLMQARLLVNNLRPEIPSRESAILDIGCGGGHLIMQLKRQKYGNLTAMDWGENLRGTLEAQGIEFISGDIEVDSGISSMFDIIILNNVIEHLVEPERALRHLKLLLKPGGRILLITPNERSLCHWLFGRNWSGLHAPRHIYIFNPETLMELAGRQGFRTYYRFLLDPSGWAISIQNVIRKYLRNSSPHAGTSWFTLSILPGCIVTALLEHLFRWSSSMLVVLEHNRA